MNKISEHIYSWCDDLDENTLQQAINVTQIPHKHTHVALMPDSHLGYGVPIGCVFGLNEAICPNAIGVDIGCSVTWVQTTLEVSNINKEQLKEIVELVREKVPVGFECQDYPIEHDIFDWYLWDQTKVGKECFDEAHKWIGTLGGGNHFIEFQKDQNGYFCWMIHTGSRQLGKKVCEYYNQLAEESCRSKGLGKVISDKLSFLTSNDIWYSEYLDEMKLCLKFALANHEIISEVIASGVKKVLGDFSILDNQYIQHNFAGLEEIDNESYWIHRKGATPTNGTGKCLILGSQGTSSYVARGLFNELSFNSCSHGAGRTLSRTRAKSDLNLENEIKKLDELGILHSIKEVKDLEEAPSAYKDIDHVMEEQSDLVQVINELTPLAVIKG